MTTTIWKEIRFESAHRLPLVPPGHKCGYLHGHSYRAEIHVSGVPDPVTGWLIDFSDIVAASEAVRLELDHRYLNDVTGLENPTSEVLAKWLFERLSAHIPGLSAVVIRETCTSGCRYGVPA